MKKKKSRKLNISRALLYAFLIGFMIIQIYPFFYLILMSLKSNGEIFGSNVLGFPERFRWENYQSAIVNGKVGLYLFNSAFITFVTILGTTILSTMAAYAISRMRWRFSKPMLTIFLMGLMIPVHATLLPLFLFFSKLDILDTYWCLILPYIGFAMPIAMYIFVGFIKNIPIEMEESAFCDGCSIYRVFIRIIFPLLKPAIATVAIFTFLQSWNELMYAITFINLPKYRTLTVGIQSMVGQYVTNWGAIAAGLVIASLPAIIMYSFISKQVQKSLIAGAVKG